MPRAHEAAPKAKWLCNRCVHTSGKAYENLGFRDECHKCTRRKGIAFLANVPKPPPRAPTPLAVRQVQQQPRSHLQALQQGSKGKGKGKGDQRSETAKLRAENQRLKKALQDEAAHKGDNGKDNPEAMDVTDEDSEKFDFTLDNLHDQLRMLRSQQPNGHVSITNLQAQIEVQKAAQLRKRLSHVRMAKAKQSIDNAGKAQAIVESRQQKLEEELAKHQERKAELEQLHLKAVQSVQEAKAQRDKLFQELQAEPKDSQDAPAANPTSPAQQLVKACETLPAEFFGAAGTDRETFQKLLQALVTALLATQGVPVVAAAATQPAALAEAKTVAAVVDATPAVKEQGGQQAQRAPGAEQPKKETTQQNDKDATVRIVQDDGLVDFSDFIADPQLARVVMERVQAAQRASPYGK